MNYAWANPSTGIREQANSKEEARLQAWEALHKSPINDEMTGPDNVEVFEQEPAGWVSSSYWDRTEFEPWNSYAWTDPVHGKRCQSANWEDAVIYIQAGWPEHSPVDSVAVYRQRLAFEVHWGDPKPELPAPIVISPDTPSSLIQAVMDGTCGDLGRAALLASLWTAQALQGIAVAIPYIEGSPSEMTRKQRKFFETRKQRRQPGFFERIRLRIVEWWTTPTPKAVCAECDSVLEDPEGTICPKCAAMILEKMNASSEEECRPADNLDRDQVRTQAVKLRPIDPQKPHVFMHAPWGDNANDPRCWVTGCGKPELDAIHGYTGD